MGRDGGVTEGGQGRYKEEAAKGSTEGVAKGSMEKVAKGSTEMTGLACTRWRLRREPSTS